MKTDVKQNLSDEKIRQMAARHFPFETIHHIKPLRGGTFNSVYVLHGTGPFAKGIVLKVGPAHDVILPEHEKHIMESEVKAYQLLQHQDIPVPKLYAYDDSRQDLDSRYVFIEYLPGKSWYDYWPVRDKKVNQALGEYTARMTNLTGSHFGSLTNPDQQFDTWSKAYGSMIGQALKEARERNLNLPYEEIEDAVKRNRDLLDEIKTPSFVDFDMWAGNVLLDEKDGLKVSGVIDFERCFYGDPLATFAASVLVVDNIERQEPFLTGYNAISHHPISITQKDRIRMILYDLLFYVRSCLETERYGLLLHHLQQFSIRSVIGYLLWMLKEAENKEINV